MISRLAVRTFLPRSRISLGVMGMMLMAGIGLPLVIEQVAAERHDWLMQYMCSFMLMTLGVALGNTLGAVRGWPQGQMVPNLINAHIMGAVMLVLVVWAVYLLFMLGTERTYRLPLTISLTAGLLGLMFGAGVHKQLIIPLAALGSVPLTFALMQDRVVETLQSPAAETISIALLVLCLFELVREYNKVPAESDTTFYRKLMSRGTGQYVVKRPRFFVMDSVARYAPRQAFGASIEHSIRQAWFNDLITFVGLNAMILLPLFIFWPARLEEAFNVVPIVTSILIVSGPLILRSGFFENAEFLWLTGMFSSRYDLYLAGFKVLMRSAVRHCVFALSLLGMFYLMSLNTGEGMGQDISFGPVTLLICSVGSAALMLATVMVLNNKLKLLTNPFTLLAGVLMIVELSIGVWVSLKLLTLTDLWLAMTSAVIFALVVTLLSAHLTAVKCSRS